MYTELRLLGSTWRARYSRDAAVRNQCLLLEVPGNQNLYRNAYITCSIWCSHLFIFIRAENEEQGRNEGMKTSKVKKTRHLNKQT